METVKKGTQPRQKTEVNKMTKTYFFPDDYTEFDIFGQEMPVCIDRAECERLARDYEMDVDDFMDNMHEATETEIEEYGIAE
nr:MAG TPA: hypothetical protein [Caudoviricetes sp.]